MGERKVFYKGIVQVRFWGDVTIPDFGCGWLYKFTCVCIIYVYLCRYMLKFIELCTHAHVHTHIQKLILLYDTFFKCCLFYQLGPT